MTRVKDPTQAELQEVFEIIDGKIWRKEYVSTNGRKYGGCFIENVANTRKGYCQVWFKGRKLYYHRIFQTLEVGYIEDEKQIDHLDGNKLNNDINNLVPKTARENNQNRRIHRERKVCGIHYDKQRGKWQAQITVNGKKIYRGRFDTELEAFDAYIQANRDYGFPVEHLLKLRAEYIERSKKIG